MLIERRSLVSGVIRTLDLPVTEDQIEAWEQGMKIQDAMPNLTDSQREFILTGVVDMEWDMLYKEEYLPEDDNGFEFSD